MSFMDNKKLYLKTNPFTLFLKAALPGSISMLVSSLYMIFDSIFVGKFVGTDGFAALGLAIPLVIINFSLADLIGVGSSVPISIFLGQKRDDKANNYFTCATIMIVLTGLLMGAVFFIFAPQFMSLMGANKNLIKLGTDYIRVYAAFSPLTTITFALDNFLRISGKIKTSMVLNIAMSLGTILIELLFIVVFGWGMVGAALGASLSMFICVLIGLTMFISGKLQLKFVKPKFNRQLIFGIIKNGLPAFLNNVSGRMFSIIMNIMLLKMGGADAVAVYGILMTVSAIVEQLLYGIFDSLQPAIGYNYGALENNRVKQIEKYCIIVGAFISITFAVLFISFPVPFAIPFLENMSLLDLSTRALRLFGIAFVFKWISHAFQSFLLAIDKAFPSTIITVSTAFIFPTALVFALLPLKLDGLWLNYTLTCFLGAVLALIIMFKLKDKLFIQITDK